MRFYTVAATAASLMAVGRADNSNIPSCGAGQNACPEEYPCCSTDGTCGNGYVCLGGCDPRYSYEPGACVAMPICKSGSYSFNGTDNIYTYADYLGDSESMPWSYLGNITSVDGKLRAKMTQDNTATTISSSMYVWYGKVTIKMRTSRTGGVVSDFILLSGSKDEVDYEFPGYELENAQTNYYYEGILDYQNMVKEPVSSDTQANYHEYTIDWQENQINWIIDGNTVRTLNKQDTFNSTSNTYKYPQTPSRIQFGLWAGGDSSAQGTQQWAGGPINWNAPDMQNPGYFYIEVDSIDVQCYDPPKGVNQTGNNAYVFTNKNAQEGDVAITNDATKLEATDGTGLDLAGPYGHNSSSSAASSSSSTKPGIALSGASFSSSAAASSKSLLALSGASVSSSSAAPSSSLIALSGASVSSSSASSTSKATSSSSSSSSSAQSSSSSGGSDNGGAGAGAGAAQSSSSPAATSTAQSSSSSQSSATANARPASGSASASESASASAPKKNGAAVFAVPGLAAIVPVLFL